MNQVKNTNNLIQTYEVFKQKYTPQEEVLLSEIRENLVDLAISTGENFHLDENKLLNENPEQCQTSMWIPFLRNCFRILLGMARLIR